MTGEETITVFTIVGFVVTLIIAILSTFAYFRGQVGKATILQQAELIKALTARVDVLSDQNTELTKQIGLQSSKIVELENHNRYLENVVTGKQELGQLVKEMLDHRAEVKQLHTERAASLDRIETIVTLLKEGLLNVSTRALPSAT